MFMNTPEKYVLLDANVIAGYYFPQTLKYKIAAERIKTIIDSVKKVNSQNIKLLAPDICIAETFTVMSKYANTIWKNKPKKKIKESIHKKTYNSRREHFKKDIHNGKVIEVVDIHRYHILTKHFVSPVDHITPSLQKGEIKNTINELVGMDQLIAGMSIWLSMLFGRERIILLTSDYRLAYILRKGRNVTTKQAKDWGFLEISQELDMEWSQDIYPNVIDLANDEEKVLRKYFGAWPLLTKAAKLRKTKRVTKKNIEKLIELYRSINIPRDRLPYTKEMDRLTKIFSTATGVVLSNAEVWALLMSRLKEGSGKLKISKQ